MRLHGKKCKACREAWARVNERQDRMKWNFDRVKDYDEYCRTIAPQIVKT